MVIMVRIFYLSLVIVPVVFFISSKVKAKEEANKIEIIKQEYTAQLEEDLNKLYEDEDCIKFQLSDISCTVTDLQKALAKGEYSACVVVDCTSTMESFHFHSWDKDFFACVVNDYVPGYIRDFETSTGDRITLRNYDNTSPNYCKNMLTINLNGECIYGPEISK